MCISLEDYNSHSRKLKLRIFVVHVQPCFNPAYFKLSSRPNSDRSLSASVPFTAITQAIQEIEVLRKHRLTKRKAKSGSNRFYERPGYEATFTTTLKQSTEIAISLCRQF